jgi:hydrogenase maturation protein HypF
MELEMMAASTADYAYDCHWPCGAPVQIPTAPIIRAVVEDLLQGTVPALISARFHLSLVRLFTDLCVHVRIDPGLLRVVLSGGVFQNAILLSGLVRALEDKKLKVYTHKQVPTNDGGLSLGQAIIAAATATRSQSA